MTAREEALDRANKRESPSTEAMFEKVRLRQKRNIPDALFNSRPLSLEPTPIAVYEPAFARFVSKVNRTNIVPGDFNSEELEFALEFIRTCSKHFENELRRSEELETLDIPGLGELWIRHAIYGTSSTYRPDGGRKYLDRFRRRVFTIIAELENEKGEGKCDASDQVQCCYTKAIISSQASTLFTPSILSLAFLPTLNQYEELRQQSCCPAFLIALTGADLVIWGAVTAERFFFEPLASVMLVPMPKGLGRSALENKMLEVVNVFRALKEGVDELEKHYAGLPRPPPVLNTDSAIRSRLIATRPGGNTSRSSGGPAIHTKEYIPGMFPRWRKFVSNAKEYNLQYVRRLPTNFEVPVFVAKMISDGSEVGEDVVVKFTPSYCPEAHKLLEELKLAPKLYYADFESCAEDKPDAPDMWVVVMEFIEHATHPPMQLEEEHKTKLTKCVDALHAKGYVHGDLRRPNILVRNDELFLVDFDWANKKSKARYPLHISLTETHNTHNWHPGVTRGGVIEVEHDVYRLNNMIAGNV